jgi:tight adherence protein B
MSPIVVTIAAFVAVSAFVMAIAMFLRGGRASKVEDRLDMLAGLKSGGSAAASSALLRDEVLAQLDAPGIFEAIAERLGGLANLFQQADTTLTPTRFFLISAVLGGAGAALAFVAGSPLAGVPIAGMILGAMPLGWLMMRRRKRLKVFATQLPDALELISRALRAGHSLGSGLNLVGEEMPAPIGTEFNRVFEEQNLGIPLDEALKSLTLRVPNLDLKFFVTAVVLQRQTGGDLAEILDKIGHLIRERFKIWGQIQALTGEGRLSGIVLLALPPLLFLAVYYLNPDYCMVLFTDPMGQKMMAGAVFLQIVGALVIKKIVNIKV